MSDHWEPNQEYLHMLVSMGISHSIATEALFCTGNKSVDDAVNYVFNNPDDVETDSKVVYPQGESTLVEENDENVKYYKMTFVVNTSLKMGVGKIAAQVGHACLGLYRDMLERNKEDDLSQWEYTGEKKIVLKGNNELHLQELFERAKASSIPCYLVRDAGHTQIAPNSLTVLSLFGPEDEVNKITGKLNLL